MRSQVAAGLATLKLVSAPGFYEKLSATGTHLVNGMMQAAKDAGREFSAQSLGGMFGLYFRTAPPQTYAQVMECDRNQFNRFFHAMLGQGIAFAPSAFEAGFVSSAHGQAEIEETLEAARTAFARQE